MVYNPQGTKTCFSKQKESQAIKHLSALTKDNQITFKLAKITLEYPNLSPYIAIHLTQKPQDLIEYLIRTYSNEGDTVMDCCLGSGTTAVACNYGEISLV